MKIVIVEGGCFPPDPKLLRWTPAVKAEMEEADIVIYTFNPYSHLIMKGSDDLVVKDIRERHTKTPIILEASRDEAVCQAQHARLVGHVA